MQTLVMHGWTIGSLITTKKVDHRKPRADMQWQIGHVNEDGTVGLHPVNADGAVVKEKVVMTDQVQLQQTYKAVDESARRVGSTLEVV